MKAPSFCVKCGEKFNGVGPSGLPIVTKFLQVLPSSHLFYDAANWHDYFYHTGSTDADRKNADDAFLALMLLAIKDRCKWYEKPFYKFSAYRNWFFVRKFGSTFFKYEACK
jgi:hypothetical protein